MGDASPLGHTSARPPTSPSLMPLSSLLLFPRYARLTFGAELLGAAAVILFGLCSCRTLPAATADAGVVAAKYNVNVSLLFCPSHVLSL